MAAAFREAGNYDITETWVVVLYRDEATNSFYPGRFLHASPKLALYPPRGPFAPSQLGYNRIPVGKFNRLVELRVQLV